MAKFPIGLVLRQIFDEKVISPTELAKALGISKQSVYNNFKRTDMLNTEIIKWAAALGVTAEEIKNRWNGQPAKLEIPKMNNLEESGDVYLQQHLINLEEQFKALAEQLRVKDKQMEGMQHTINVLLGKSDLSGNVTRDIIKLNSMRVA